MSDEKMTEVNERTYGRRRRLLAIGIVVVALVVVTCLAFVPGRRQKEPPVANILVNVRVLPML